MKRIKVIVVGCGGRAKAYCEAAEAIGDPYEIVAAVDINESALLYMQERFKVPANMCFKDYREVVNLGKIADCVINGTLDKTHFETTIPFLELGYDMLLEKPAVLNRNELDAMTECANKNNCKLSICHVLRYTPFYRKAKELVEQGEIGDIIHIEACENPGVLLTNSAYIRGKFYNSEISGSSFLLAKSCHDIDIICWMNNKTRPEYVSSFGGRNYITPKRAPEGATDNCFDCPHSETCIYSAAYIYVNLKREHGTLEQGKEKEEIETIKKSREKGACAYKVNSDLVDHQAVIIEFEDGSTATFSLLACGVPEIRDLYIKGTKGEIEGRLQSNRLVLRKYIVQTGGYDEEVFDISEQRQIGGHFGGDGGIITDFNSLIRDNTESISTSLIEDTVKCYQTVFAADESRERRQIIKV